MPWHLAIENVAGIRRGDAEIHPGVNAVRASNWQGKSSFLAAIETVFGTAAPLTEGEPSGRVVLRTDDDEYVVELDRSNGSVSRSGRPVLADEHDRVCADLFAFLGEDNELRRAVREGDSLDELLTRPLEFENLDERIADLQADREEVERERERAAEAADRLPGRQERVTRLETELSELRADREGLDADGGDGDATRDRLSDLRAERDREANRIDRLERTAERLRERLADAHEERDALTVPADEDPARELESLREDLRAVERDVELLRSVYEANRRVLDEGRAELLTDVSHDVLGDAVGCWLCGEEVEREAIEGRLAELDDRIGDLRAQAAEYRDRVEELESTRDERRRARRREGELSNRIGDLESRLAETEERLDGARETRAELTAEIDDLADAVDETEDRLTDVESEIKYTEAELADAREELEETARLADRRSALDDEYESLTEEITTLRNRKSTVKRRTREAFSTALSDLLDRFDTGFETARLTGSFELVVARDGREASLDALSEGERELLGIVAALAGHTAFEVDERVPALLLDGLGGLANDNLQVLIDYLDDRAEYLVLTAYPEYDGFDGHELSPGGWSVVSHGPDADAPS